MLPLLFALVFSFSACAGGRPSIRTSESPRVIDRVPFYAQEFHQCGPASLAGILNYWGEKISPADIAAAVYSKGARGTLDFDLLLYAQKRGFAARQYAGDLTDLQKNIDGGFPLLVLVDYGFWVYERVHFMVVLGYDGSKGIVVNSGEEEHKYISAAEFMKAWQRTGYWTLLIKPK